MAGTEHTKPVAKGVLRHYTDEIGKAGIEMTGEIRPGTEGSIYLTPDQFGSASEAQRRLALPRLPVGYYFVPQVSIVDATQPERVAPRYGFSGAASKSKWVIPSMRGGWSGLG